MAKDKTPVDLEITPRDRRFGRETKQDRWWFNNEPIGTAFFNALSVTFPRGEAYFIEAVKAHRDGVPPKLAREIRTFVQQEVMHTREHVAFNRKVATPVMISARSKKWSRNRWQPRKTAPRSSISPFAQQILTNGKAFESADREWADLWRWRAIEEIEHKGVAYDTWLHATKDWSRWQRWKLKSRVMLLVTLMFWPKRVRGMKTLLAQDGITGRRAMGRILWFMFGKPGMLRKALPQWLAYFLPGFHPWNHDDRALIRLADSEYDDAIMTETQTGSAVPA